MKTLHDATLERWDEKRPLTSAIPQLTRTNVKTLNADISAALAAIAAKYVIKTGTLRFDQKMLESLYEMKSFSSRMGEM